jgi:hypothetical protein
VCPSCNRAPTELSLFVDICCCCCCCRCPVCFLCDCCCCCCCCHPLQLASAPTATNLSVAATGTPTVMTVRPPAGAALLWLTKENVAARQQQPAAAAAAAAAVQLPSQMRQRVLLPVLLKASRSVALTAAVMSVLVLPSATEPSLPTLVPARLVSTP